MHSCQTLILSEFILVLKLFFQAKKKQCWYRTVSYHNQAWR